MHGRALGQLVPGAVVLHQHLQLRPRRQPQDHLGSRAEVDQPLDHGRHAVGPARAELLPPARLGPNHRVRPAGHLGRAVLHLEHRLAQPHPAVRAGAAVDDIDLHEVRDAEEVGHVGVGRLLVHLVRAAELDDLAVAHDRQPVGHGQRLLLVVRDIEEGDADLLLQRLQLDLQRPAQLGVQRAERLVKQQHRRLQHERPGQRDPLLLAAGQLSGAALGERAQLDQVQRLVDPAVQLALVQLAVAQPERDIVEHGQEGEQRIALEHGVDVPLVRRDAGHVQVIEQDPASGRLLEPGNQPQRGRLTAAGRAEQREELAAGDREVDLVDGHFGEVLGQRDQLDLATGHSGYLPFGRGLRLTPRLPRPGLHSNPSWFATKCMLSSNAPTGSTTGSSSAIWMASPSSSADRQTEKLAASRPANSPASWPLSTSVVIISRQRSSDFCRTIDDLVHEIRLRSERSERVLVTTLTKKMSEDLTDYLLELGIRARYLHSEVDTLRRIELLRELRLGEYDVLVGINLLREGLDLPEVSLVAILDADKEGFLRSGTSLIQTIGRAARNVSGQVHMYADRMTPSMRKAIDETNRRRAKQVAYNEERGVDPQPLRKKIADITDQLAREDADTEKLLGGSGRRQSRGKAPVPGMAARARAATAAAGVRSAESEAGQGGPPREDLVAMITTLSDQMHVAAAELQFELAARFRDEIRELKHELRGMQAAGV